MRAAVLSVSALLLGCGPRVEDVAQSTEDDPGTNGASTLSATDSGSAASGTPRTSSSTTGSGASSTDGPLGSSTTGERCEPSATTVACDPWMQDCSPCEKCSWYADDGSPPWNATKCFPLPDEPRAVGETCTHEAITLGGNDCERGAICWDVGPGFDEGICVALCEGSEMRAFCSDEGAVCTRTNGDAYVCLPKCDPLAVSCPRETVCGFTDQVEHGFVCAKASIQDVLFAEACNWLRVPCSEPQSVCLGVEYLSQCSGEVGCCTAYCDLQGDPVAQCESVPGTTCQSWPLWPELPPPQEWAHVGVCRD